MKSEPVPLTRSPVRDSIMIFACCTTLATLVPVALYQTGVLRHLPDPPGRIFDSGRITSSKAAHPFGVPDSLLGIASFSVTLALTLAAKRNRTARFLLGGKLAADAAFAAFNLSRQAVQFRKLCSWCTGAAVAALTMSVAGAPLIREAAIFVSDGMERHT